MGGDEPHSYVASDPRQIATTLDPYSPAMTDQALVTPESRTRRNSSARGATQQCREFSLTFGNIYVI
jgi:hypothetical protein